MCWIWIGYVACRAGAGAVRRVPCCAELLCRAGGSAEGGVCVVGGWVAGCWLLFTPFLAALLGRCRVELHTYILHTNGSLPGWVCLAGWHPPFIHSIWLLNRHTCTPASSEGTGAGASSLLPRLRRAALHHPISISISCSPPPSIVPPLALHPSFPTFTTHFSVSPHSLVIHQSPHLLSLASFTLLTIRLPLTQDLLPHSLLHATAPSLAPLANQA